MNPLYGVPKYGATGKQVGKQFRASDFTSGKLRTYFVPGQTCSWFGDPSAFNPNTYQNPVGWPKPNFVLGLPKVVQFFCDLGNAGQKRASTWLALGQSLQSQLQTQYKNLYVTLVQQRPTGPSQFPTRAFPRWMVFLAPIDYNKDFLGTDVLNIVISQDYGLTELGGDSQYYDNPAGGEGGPPVIEPSANYLTDTATIKTAYPKFRRFTTNVYHDLGIDPFDTAGQIKAFPAVNATWQAWWQNVVTNGSVYSSMGLKNFDAHLGADVDFRTTAVSFFINEVKKHFGL